VIDGDEQMSTLFDQPERARFDYDLERSALRIAELSKSTGLTVDQLIALKVAEEMTRANYLKVADGDAKDEQLGGFGNLIQNLTLTIERIASQEEM
jgi:hypothetical protein